MTAAPQSCQPDNDYAYRFQYADESAFVVYPDGTAFIEFKNGRREQKYGAIDNRIPLLIGMSAKPRQDRIDELTKARNEIIEECAKLADGWLVIHGDNEIQYTSAREYASDAVADIADAIRGLATPLEDRS